MRNTLSSTTQRIAIGCSIVFLFLFSTTLLATDLMDVYCQAIKCDPTFNAAYAELLANRENIPISRSALLPKLDIHGEAERQRISLDGINFSSLRSTGIFIPTDSSVTFYANKVNYCLKLSQPLFNYKNWAKLQQSKATVLQAEANFCAAVQDMIVRVARAYFDVMIANAELYYTCQHAKAVGLELKQSKDRFEVGVAPIINVYEAQAKYDALLAQEVRNRHTLAIRAEALRTITNRLYCSLDGLSCSLPLILPDPPDINAWASLSEKQNYQLLAARNAALAAKQNIKVQAGGKMPVINSFGEYNYFYQSNTQGSGFLTRQKIIEAGLELDWSPLQGGGIMAKTAQAQFAYQQACMDAERTHRTVVYNARNAYLSIFSAIATIHAQRQAVCSGQASLKATVDGYKAGTRTVLDILNQQTQLYSAEREFEKARYDYLYYVLLLKQATGTLSVTDLQRINRWLCSKVDIS